MMPVPLSPSPKSHRKLPVLGVDADALKYTVWLMLGLVGESTKLATTDGDVFEAVTVFDDTADWPALLVTRSVTVYDPARPNLWVTEIPDPVVPSPKSQANVPPLTPDVAALKYTS